MVSTSIAVKLVTTSINSLTSLELDWISQSMLLMASRRSPSIWAYKHLHLNVFSLHVYVDAADNKVKMDPLFLWHDDVIPLLLPKQHFMCIYNNYSHLIIGGKQINQEFIKLSIISLRFFSVCFFQVISLGYNRLLYIGWWIYMHFV